ncbi:MAG: DinB family protein [Microbacteriaceae bacterium]|nr:DinB family protein [Microbacteriaceae bacterium]
MPITTDDKNWTWALEKPCLERGFDASEISFRDIPSLIELNAATRLKRMAQPERLAQTDAWARPDDATWSPLEYAAHVRDGFRIFRARLHLMLDQVAPAFANWDQDTTAIAERYNDQDPATVAEELLAAADALAPDYPAVDDADLGRTDLRSDGSTFIVESLARYFIHDPVHHLHDVGADGSRWVDPSATEAARSLPTMLGWSGVWLLARLAFTLQQEWPEG